MSLDVYLKVKGSKIISVSSGIFIRRNGQTIEISEDEWYKLHPGQEPVRFNAEEQETDEVYQDNITHNLGEMADAAGIYGYLWRPEEKNIKTAKELVKPLVDGWWLLKADPEKFKKFNPENGWGDYDGLLRFVENYIIACIKYPEAEVGVSR